MKRILMAALLCLVLAVPVSAADLTAPEAPESAQPLMPAETESFSETPFLTIAYISKQTDEEIDTKKQYKPENIILYRKQQPCHICKQGCYEQFYTIHSIYVSKRFHFPFSPQRANANDMNDFAAS